VSAALSNLMAPIQTKYENSKEWQEITLKAYPPPEKKKPKIKNKGTGYPGAKVEKTVDLPERPGGGPA
jgi:tyrosyl-tRNA synthetase